VTADPIDSTDPIDTIDTAEHDRRLQPWLHDLVVALAAPTQVWCGPDGQVRAQGAQGVYHGDVRVLSRAELTLDGVEPVPVLVSPDGASRTVAVSVARQLGDAGPDPTVRVERRRAVAPGRVDETIVLTSSARTALTTRVRIGVAADLAPIDRVKSGDPVAPLSPSLTGGTLAWSALALAVEVTAPGAAVSTDGDSANLAWEVELGPGGRVELAWAVHARDEAAVVVGPTSGDCWDVDVRVDDRRRRRSF